MESYFRTSSGRVVATCLCACLVCGSASYSTAEEVTDIVDVTKYRFAEKFEKSSVGLGSGLALARTRAGKTVEKDERKYEFWALSDRGPNIDGPEVAVGDQLVPSKIFPSPEYGPRLARVGLVAEEDGELALEIREDMVLRGRDSKPLGGLPPKLAGSGDESSGRTIEKSLSTDLELIEDGSSGIDSEGVVEVADGFWIVEEYRPALMKFDRKGRLLKTLSPGQGLPEWLQAARPNRGLEGIALLPGGDLLISLQSPRLDKHGSSLGFIDLIRLDSSGKLLRSYKYQLSTEFLEHPEDVKIGDLSALSDSSVVAVVAWNDDVYIERFDLGDDGLISSSRVLDLRALGWKKKKTEGLVVLPDNKTLVIINDDDFEVDGEVSLKPDDLILRADGSLQTTGKVSFKVVKTSREKGGSSMWFIELKDKL